MKKLFMFLVLFSVLLCGCRADADSNVSKYHEALAKAQEITAFAADTEKAVKDFTSKEDIDSFVTALKIDEWELAEPPHNATEIGHFDFSQEETLSLGQTETDGNLYAVCKITLYDGSYIDFEIAGLRMSFEITRDTADYLTGLLTQ